MLLYKDIKNVLFDNFVLVIDNAHYENFNQADTRFDNYEVIGIRTNASRVVRFHDSYLTISLKKIG